MTDCSQASGDGGWPGQRRCRQGDGDTDPCAVERQGGGLTERELWNLGSDPGGLGARPLVG